MEGTQKFSCKCPQQFVGERCEDEPCKFYPICQNNGTCIIDFINDTPTARCECYGNTAGALCDQVPCNIPCHNGGMCIKGETCQCIKENGIAKYHGESCEMPGRDPCDQNPCQNGGNCSTTIQAGFQVCFIRTIRKFAIS